MEGDEFEDLTVNGRTILKCMFKNKIGGCGLNSHGAE
jgi:hypothetical protein